MYYFDNEYLKQYLGQDASLKVFVNGQWFTVADPSDLETSAYGFAYNAQGEPTTFDYREIEQIKGAGRVITIDQLQSTITGQEAPEDDGGEDAPSMGEPPGGGGEESPGAPAPEGPPAEEAPPEETAPPEEESPNEVSRRLIGDLLTEKKKKTKKVVELDGIPFVRGDIIQNTNMRSEYAGSRGTITNLIPADDEDGVCEVEYTVFNMGYNFKPGDKVTELITNICKIK